MISKVRSSQPHVNQNYLMHNQFHYKMQETRLACSLITVKQENKREIMRTGWIAGRFPAALHISEAAFHITAVKCEGNKSIQLCIKKPSA